MFTEPKNVITITTRKILRDGQAILLVARDQDQMELEFPPEFLVACGKHALKMFIISNDIPAHEVLAVRNAEQHDAPDVDGV